MSRVFRTYELLQSILLEPPARDILLLQRTSRSFHYIISRSIHLQRRLFFAPTSKCLLREEPDNRFFTAPDVNESELYESWTSTRHYRTHEGTELVLNPFLPKSSHLLSSCINSLSGLSPSAAPYVRHGQAILDDHQEVVGISGRLMINTCSSFGCSSDGRRLEVIERKEASWRKMFVTQPPLSYTNIYDRDAPSTNCSTVIRIASGITIGNIQAATENPKFPIKHPRSLKLEVGTVSLMLPKKI